MPLGPRLLLIGYGNPGRGDDGLGPALAERLAVRNLPGVTVEIDYQLTVDHAALIAAHDLVIFADAAVGLAVPFRLSPITGRPQGLGSHQVSPEAALHLAGQLYGKTPEAWVLAIAGADFGQVHEGLSPPALSHLAAAEAALADWIGHRLSTRPGSTTERRAASGARLG